jgi:hypothetical protein
MIKLPPLAVNEVSVHIRSRMDKTKKQLLREKVSRRAALVDAVEDHNIQILALTGEIRWLDQEIEMLVEDVKLEAIRVANERFREFENREIARLEESKKKESLSDIKQ